MARKITVEILGDASSLERAFSRSSRSAKRFQGDMKKNTSVFRGFGKVVGLAAGALGAVGLAGAARAVFDEFSEGQKVTAQTNAVLRSTAKAANVSRKQVDKLADSLSEMSGVDDEAIKSGENLLLTFTNIRNEVGKGNNIFDQATETMLDMSVALGQDTTSSAIQLGKALNDPIKGITALRRVGVSFTEDQIDLIKSLVETGHTMEAQKVILRELTREFGGSAKAAGDTLGGKLNILRNTVLNLSATLLGKLMPAITNLVDRAVKWLNNSKNQKQILDTVTAAAEALAAVLRTLQKVFETLNRITGSTANTLKILFGALVAIKTLQMVAALKATATSIGLVGRQAQLSTGRVRGLRGSLLALGKIGIIGVGVELIFGESGKGIKGWLEKTTGLDFDKGLAQNIIAQATEPDPRNKRGTKPGLKGPAGVVVHGDLVVENPRDVDGIVREVQRRGGRNAGSRRGVRAGVNRGMH